MQSEERSGLLFALCGYAVFTFGDTTTKTMAGLWSPAAIAALRFTIGAVALGAILYVKEGSSAFVPRKPWLQAARGLCLGISTLSFFSAFFLMPLAVATAIAFVAPAITALLSGPLLGEKVRPVTWLASALAFVGVLIILRPNVMELGLAAFLPLIGALGMSLLMISNRASAGQGSALSMQFFVAAGAAPVLIVAAALGHWSGLEMLAVGWPDWSVVARCCLVAITGSTGHWLVYLGTTRAGASVVAPSTYIQLLAATVLGWAVFGHVPDLPTMIGAAVIIFAGLLLWRSGRALASARAR